MSSKDKATLHRYKTHYGESRELEIVYRALYGGDKSAFHDFIHRKVPVAKIPLETDLSPDALDQNPALKQALALEPDLRLRQFIWFLRPSAQLLAFDAALSKWQWITELLHPKDLKRLPWESLRYTGAQIEGAIVKHLEHREDRFGKDVAKFKDFPYFGTQSRVGVKKAKNNKNPMVGRGSSTYPLYTQTLNDPPPPPGRSLSSSDAQYRQRLNALLTAFTLIRAAERRRTSESIPEGTQNTSREARFLNPYRFLQEDLSKAPDNGKQQLIDRLVREASQERDTVPWEILAPFLSGTYREFCGHCRTLLDDSTDSAFKSQSLRSLLDFFAHARRGGAHTEGGAGNIRQQVFSGHHDWTPPKNLIHQEESVTGLTVDVVHLRDASMVLEELLLEDAEFLAERAILEDRPGVEILLSDQDDAASEFLLEQHASHSQLLQATLNQPLWWNQSTFSRADMRSWLTYLASEELKANIAKDMHVVMAIQLLRLTLAIGLSPELSVQLEMAPRQRTEWLTGTTEFSFKGDRPGHDLPLRLVTISPGGLAYWVLPLKVRAYQHRSSDQITDLYLPHTRALPIADHLGIAKGIQRGAPRIEGSLPVPRFSRVERKKLPLLCKEILLRYNDTHPQKLSVAILRRFWRSQLMRQGLSQRLVDLLSEDVPLTRVPSLHYAAWGLGHLNHKKDLLALPLIDAISEATKLDPASRQNQSATPSYSTTLTMGATALPNPSRIKALIENLTARIKNAPAHIGDTASCIQFQDAFNAYSLWMALWFMIETSHRPHHDVYANWRDIDPLWGTLVLKDKSNESGDKYRLAVVSPALKEAMRCYEERMTHMHLWAQLNGFSAKGTGLRQMNLLVHVEQDAKELRPIEDLIEGFNAKTFSVFLAREFPEKPGLEPNFNRRLGAFLLQLPPALNQAPFPRFKSAALEEPDIHAWLGHWQQGTAPFHRFSSHRARGTFERIAMRMQEIVAYLGFAPLSLGQPTFDFKVIDALRGPDE